MSIQSFADFYLGKWISFVWDLNENITFRPRLQSCLCFESYYHLFLKKKRHHLKKWAHKSYLCFCLGFPFFLRVHKRKMFRKLSLTSVWKFQWIYWVPVELPSFWYKSRPRIKRSEKCSYFNVLRAGKCSAKLYSSFFAHPTYFPAFEEEERLPTENCNYLLRTF